MSLNDYVDEEILTANARLGDREAYAEMAERAKPQLFRAARAILRSDAAAEDAVQDAVQRGLEALESYDGRAKISTWLTTILVNRCLDQRKAPGFSAASLDDATARMIADASAPDGATDSTLIQAMHGALADQPEKIRRAWTMRVFEEAEYEVIAETLGCAVDVARVWVYRARLAVRRALKNSGYSHKGDSDERLD